MAEPNMAVAALTKYLQNLPIYPIFENCSEKDNFTALQFMYIVDFHANYYIKLYDRIKGVQQPKLLGQLLQFRQFEKFRYFHYSVAKQYGNSVLQCRYCPLVGPCGCILSHMAINHNVHTGLKHCVFCNGETHVTSNSLFECYKNYIQRNDIEIDEKVCEIVAIFYDMMRKLSRALNICVERRKGYVGQGHKHKERLSKDYGGDILPECVVRYMIPKSQLNRTIRSETLDREFRRIMEILCGGIFPSIFRNNQSPAVCENPTEIGSSNEDDEEVNNITEENGRQPQFVLQDAHTLSNDEMIQDDMASTSTPTDRMSTASRPCSAWTPTNESQEFALNIARKLDKIPPSKRRQLEIDIEMKILQTEAEAIQEGCFQ
ncbi:uncharacterized protein LOC119072517 isoform X1 [Bradysia coprophila]|uniref:uncharacterized protein LOC119072517 isoform X1 n=1 Tax=Bradysia coprophila TaxID=38358 RepID=UPI00187D9421|nr:uncharacterized protein LOC119072517 isoform X1 [Bradysia coprophila]